MKQNWMSRVVVAILLGSLCGWFVHHDLVKWNLRGRDAFIAYQMHRFDLYMTSPRPLVHYLVTTALSVVGACMLYELLVATLSSIVNFNTRNSAERG